MSTVWSQKCGSDCSFFYSTAPLKGTVQKNLDVSIIWSQNQACKIYKYCTYDRNLRLLRVPQWLDIKKGKFQNLWIE